MCVGFISYFLGFFELRSMLCCIVSIMVHGRTGSWQLPPLWTKVSSAGQMCVDCNDPYGSTGYRCQATAFPFPCKQRAYSPGLCWGRQGETSLYVCEQKAKKRCSNEFFTDHIPMSQVPGLFFPAVSRSCSLALSQRCEDLIWSSEWTQKTLI